MKFVILGLLFLESLNTAVLASPVPDLPIKLYNEHRFKEAVAVFEKNYAATTQNANAEYYYALSLSATGQTGRGVKICQDILNRFPSAQAAKLAKLAITRWTHGIPDSEKSDDLGIIAIKFVQEGTSAPVVGEVFPDGPAANFLKVGDVILKIDDIPMTNFTKEEVYGFIVGKPGTALKITVRRDNEEITRTITRVALTQYSKLQKAIGDKYLEK